MAILGSERALAPSQPCMERAPLSLSLRPKGAVFVVASMTILELQLGSYA